MDDFYVEIRYANDVVVESFGPHSERSANKIEAGLNINLNHDEFYTMVVKSTKREE